MYDPDLFDPERIWEMEGEIARLIQDAHGIPERQCQQVSKEILEYVVSILRPQFIKEEPRG